MMHLRLQLTLRHAGGRVRLLPASRSVAAGAGDSVVTLVLNFEISDGAGGE